MGNQNLAKIGSNRIGWCNKLPKYISNTIFDTRKFCSQNLLPKEVK